MRKVLSIILCAVMLLGALPGTLALYAKEELPFTDVAAGDWYYDAVESVYASGIMTGKTATTFDPKANMSRAEFVTVLSRIAAVNAATVGYSDKLNFTDTDPDAWYADAAGWAVDAGLTKGTSDTTFSPTRQITRQEMAVLIVRFVDYLGEKVPDNAKVDKFADADKIADWAKADIETMRKYGLIAGDQNGNFNPLGNADRASVATIVMRLMPNVSTTYVVEGGKSDYTIVADETGADAAERIQYQVRQQTGAELEIAKTAKSKKAIELVKVGGMTNDSYEIKLDGEKITINASTAEGLYKGASRFLKAHTFGSDVKLTSCAAETYTWTYPIGKLTINGNDIGKYKIVHSANASAQTLIGVNDLVEYIEKATGVKLEVTTKKSDYSIIVEEKTVIVANAGNDLDSFKLKSEGNDIHVTGSAARGAMYGCYELLEQIGWRFLTDQVDFIRPVAQKDLAGLDMTESSVFTDRRIYTSAFNYSVDMKNKLRDVDTRAFAGVACHTFDYLDGDYSTQYENQPCLTDPAVYELMLKNAMTYLENTPSANLISISQNDNRNYCACDNCTEAMKKYEDENGNGGAAGLMIEFVNKFAVEIEKKYPNVLVHTFAYTYTRTAPQNITPHHNVVVQLCSVECCFTHGLTDDNCSKNIPFTKDISDWSKLSGNLHIWDYYINFWFRGTPFPNLKYDVLAGNLQFFAENNVTSLFLQANGDCRNNGEFDHLRNYLLAKLAWNPYISEEEYDTHIRDFMEGFYGDGWEDVYKAFNVLHDNYCVNANHLNVFDRPTDAWMPRKLSPYLDELITLMDTAKIKSESDKEFCAVDASQIQFEFIKCDLVFNDLYNSGDPAKVQQSQDMSFALQAKMQKYKIIMGDGADVPNYTEFICSPSLWKAKMPK